MKWTLENWIWTDDETRCPLSVADRSVADDYEEKPGYAVAEFEREYRFKQKVVKAELRFSGDTAFVLSLNGKTLATGPVNSGGDFLGNDLPRPRHYATEMTAAPDSDILRFYARIKLGPVDLNEYSKGHGGFMLSGMLTLEDGTLKVICTDENWQCRMDRAYTMPFVYDGSVTEEHWRNARIVPNVWHSVTAPIPPRTEERIFPEGSSFQVAPGETLETVLPLEKIYGGMIAVEVMTAERLELIVNCFETDEEGSFERFVFIGKDSYRGFQMHSAGGFRIRAVNRGSVSAEFSIGLIATCYPADRCARTVTSDPELNRILEVCAHTLKYCRQMMHLDSPRHSEPLACTGDYYIEMLMTAFSYGDMRLAKLDVLRTADLMRHNDGRIFHTTYSLIWVLMLEDLYRFTADRQLLTECLDAMILLLDRFEGYVGETGLIEDSPDYMFVDWLYIDGISLHHPPKALGQTCLNMFYYGALCSAERICAEICIEPMARKYRAMALALKEAVNTLLYDPERGLYFEGLNTPTDPARLKKYLPQNVKKRYYRMHANILAAYTGIREDVKALLRRIMSDPSLGVVQPYFAHFLLEAIRRCGLCEEFTMSVLDLWRKPIAECSKGLVEGFYKPEPSYSFDHSHAWGGTPLYSLPMAMLGLEITEPGWKAIRLTPSLLGLELADIEVPTPFGTLRCRLERGKAPVLQVPEGIKLTMA